MPYTINTICSTTEEDTPSDGCIPGYGSQSVYPNRITSTTKQGLLKKLADHYGTTPDRLVINPSGDNPSQVSYSTLETGSGATASDSDIEAWKAGNMRLWAADYDAYVVHESTADMTQP